MLSNQFKILLQESLIKFYDPDFCFNCEKLWGCGYNLDKIVQQKEQQHPKNASL